MDPNLETQDTEEAFDTEAALAEISKGLFGQSDGEDTEVETSEVVPEPVPSAPTEVELAPAQEPVAEQTSEAVQETGAPKTWTKEALETWATIPDRAKAEILKREEDMFRGLEQYREKADLGRQYDSVVEPYKNLPAFQGVNPVELFQNFAGNHYLLTTGTPYQKQQIFKNFADFYGINTAELLNMANPNPPSPEVQQLRQEMAQLRQAQIAREQAEAQQVHSTLEAQVDAFSKDPKNIYFPEVASDIATLLKAGVANTLEQAYDMAVYQNLSTRQRELDRMTAEAISKAQTSSVERLETARLAKAANVKTSIKTRDGTMPVGSMDDTLRDTMEAIAARG